MPDSSPQIAGTMSGSSESMAAPQGARDQHEGPAFETVEVGVNSGLAHLVLTGDDGLNSMSATFCQEFGQAAHWISGHPGVRAVLVSARGRYFSVGGEVGQFARDLDGAPATVLRGTSGLHSGLARLLRMDAPIIVCIQGPAAGGAVSLLSHGDVVVAARSVSFSAAYTRLGFSVDLGASFGLAARMGISRAKRFLLLGETLDAEQALSSGLVDVLVDDDAVLAEAIAVAEALAQGPTIAFGEMRRLMARSLSTSAETQLEDEAQALSRVAGTLDAREGITAFSDRRRPRFIGR